jgi:predicted Zn-dependent protease
MQQMALQRLKQLAAHEIGHTLGIMHNYISSTQKELVLWIIHHHWLLSIVTTKLI